MDRCHWGFLDLALSGCTKTVTVCRTYGKQTVCEEMTEKEVETRDQNAIDAYLKMMDRKEREESLGSN